jgi:hypothetical protein
MMAHGCPANAIPIATNLHVRGTTQAGLTPMFDQVSNLGVSIDQDGTMHFENVTSPVVVTVNLVHDDNSATVFDHTNGFNVFGFNDADSDGYSGLQVMPQQGHYQFRKITASDLSVTFCYMNRLKNNDPHYRWSRYVIYVTDPASPNPLQVDPRIGNGGFSGTP